MCCERTQSLIVETAMRYDHTSPADRARRDAASIFQALSAWRDTPPAPLKNAPRPAHHRPSSRQRHAVRNALSDSIHLPMASLKPAALFDQSASCREMPGSPTQKCSLRCLFCLAICRSRPSYQCATGSGRARCALGAGGFVLGAGGII